MKRCPTSITCTMWRKKNVSSSVRMCAPSTSASASTMTLWYRAFSPAKSSPTPAPNGTFLNGITRQRVIKLLRDDGITVVEATLRYEDFKVADEIFSTLMGDSVEGRRKFIQDNAKDVRFIDA